ncbi:MAG: aspartate dehydrogenase [Candidatus Bathyarchaeota archaeon]|nr:aspartate dehydrogenase [Candidatus Bathyarchaeota archaeon]
MRKVGIIGCGAIGTVISRAIERRIVECDELVLYDYNIEKAEKLKKSLHFSVTVVKNLGEMIKLEPAVIVEAASQQAVRDYMDRILAENIELIVMSVGALLDLNIKSNKIHIPSGAIGGVDAISSASLAGVDQVILTTSKNPRALDMDNREEKLVYEGTAEEAVRLFPREMNVAATLALTAQPEKVKVKIISDPKVDRNVHEIKIKWKHGDMLLKFSNDPHPENPKTSALAAWSAIKLLNETLDRYARTSST